MEIPVLPMTWWQENYEKNGDYSFYKSIAAFNQRMISSLFKKDIKKLDLYIPPGVLCAGISSGNKSFLWIKNEKRQLSKCEVLIDHVAKGQYDITLYDTFNGIFDEPYAITIDTNQLKLEISEFDIGEDIAYIIGRKNLQ